MSITASTYSESKYLVWIFKVMSKYITQRHSEFVPVHIYLELIYPLVFV